ncbi:uncharacterized protein [Physcomitrium patens]|uniref:RRM domain-containing protein n=2 Tax=Physcomitrium patens TaxID=3218 RepID=A0A2K1JS08_PHYPA|nr:probable splicing factor, arginine/serine-rich 4 [Physcomitrium patens]XP_024391189.1 probable splicing factor, arginine/serine-rich 4 [Physcomitrium patens]XP_024391190.1 probable splicing factor, arginine/serine-rich 4 [Physcomitrium patens]XP_024391191.1 probable splicing factor, arginine/serine-rich 4 [Physcomitrium patens]XP_024391192.1 probable splicing factor, arginine/serine-rich 4 [Physcomitrium patens]XP_024391193.1 probable splicing factor, arginine/serine-rich 4 [Physcomitrium p|eukprot:XP_024391188.1 probable splicing factor, arginine/serine-rich 4 [Physcomitrella patens]
MDDANSVYVGGLSYESTEDTVRKHFMTFGEVLSVKIVHDKMSGESRGFGFVTFANQRSASMAISDGDGVQIEGRCIRVNQVRKNKGFYERTFKFRDRRERSRRQESPPFRERLRHRTRSPILLRSRSHPPLYSSEFKMTSPNSSAGGYNTSEPEERAGAGSSVSPQSSEGGTRKESVYKGGNSNSKLRSRIATAKGEGGVRRLQEELEATREHRRGLEEKVAHLKGVVERADVTIAALKSKSHKLEESLASAQNLVSQRSFQLKRLQTSVFHFKLAVERLTSSEKEMKDLAALTSLEVDEHPRTTTDTLLVYDYAAEDELNHESEENNHNNAA